MNIRITDNRPRVASALHGVFVAVCKRQEGAAFPAAGFGTLHQWSVTPFDRFYRCINRIALRPGSRRPLSGSDAESAAILGKHEIAGADGVKPVSGLGHAAKGIEMKML